MAKSAGGAAAAAKHAEKPIGAMAAAKKMADRKKADKAHKRKAQSDEDEMEDDEEEQTSDSDTGAPLIQAMDDRERRAEKLRKLQRDKKAEEELDKTLAEQEAKNAKKNEGLDCFAQFVS